MKIFVVTVCLNANAALRETVESLRKLASDDIYFSVVDGNSKDGTQNYLIESGDVVNQWVSKNDAGIYYAMNEGVNSLPPGEGHILFLGAGDRLLELPDENDRMKDCCVLYGNVLVGDHLFKSTAGWKLRAGNTIHHQGAFYPRRVLSKFAFDTRYRIYSDFDLNQRLMLAKIPFVPIGKTTAYAAPGGISWAANQSEVIAISRKNFGKCWAVIARIWLLFRTTRAALSRKPW